MRVYGEFARFVPADQVSRLESEIDRAASQGLLGEILSVLEKNLGAVSDISLVAFAAELTDAAQLARCLRDLSPAADCDQPSVVVLGLPRTGTTLLQNVLHQLFARGSLQGWELALSNLERCADGRPPNVELAAREVDSRYANVAALSPEVMKAHPLGASQLEECTPIFRASGRHYPWSAMSPRLRDLEELLLGDFGERTAHREWSQAYSVLRPPPAVVKSPLHTGYAESLAATVPNAVLLVVRRRLSDVVSSYGHLVYHASLPFAPDYTIREAGSTVLRQLRAMSQAFATARSNGLRVIPVDYDELIASPLGALSTALSEVESGPDLEAALQQTCRRDVSHSTTVPESRSLPSLSDLGVSRSSLSVLCESVPELCKP